jgi:hypothetical protein
MMGERVYTIPSLFLNPIEKDPQLAVLAEESPSELGPKSQYLCTCTTGV